MILRPQTVRRLMILLAAVVMLVAVGAALYFHNEHRKFVRLSEARQSGLTAFKSGDYRAALDSLKFYVARNKSDPEALYAYGVSRARLEEPNGKQVLEAIAVFNMVLQIDPAHLEAKHALLDLYTRAFYDSEALDLSDRLLQERSDDVKSLRT